jgi:hypothetical protein
MSMRIVFGLMASHEPAAAVAQLVDALAPHRVVLHLDAACASALKIERPNLSNVPDASATGWGNWGLTRAILRTVRHAAEVHDFDYFQLLSPSCLPIRPLADFRAHILQDRIDIHADLMPVEGDDDTFMTFGYRTYLPGSTMRFRVLRRMRGWYFGARPPLVQYHSLSLHRRLPRPAITPSALGGYAGLALTRLAARGALGSHPFGPALRPRIGSTWFGAHRHACECMLQMSEVEPWSNGFKHLHLVDETLLATLIAQTGLRIGTSNHAISRFDAHGHPCVLTLADMPALEAGGRFFARKFTLQPEDAARQMALEWVGVVPSPAPSQGLRPVGQRPVRAEDLLIAQGAPIGTPRLSIQPM